MPPRGLYPKLILFFLFEITQPLLETSCCLQEQTGIASITVLMAVSVGLVLIGLKAAIITSGDEKVAILLHQVLVVNIDTVVANVPVGVAVGLSR